MNSIYNTFQRLNNSDSVALYKKLKISHGLTEEKIANVINSFTNIIIDNPDIPDRIVASTSTGKDLIEALVRVYNFSPKSLEHCRKADSISMLKNMLLYDTLEDLYNIVRVTDGLTEEMFAFAWSMALMDNKFTDLLYAKVPSKEIPKIKEGIS